MLQKIIQVLRTDVCILEGLEASTNEHLKIFFSGEKSEKSYIKKIAFNDKCQEDFIGKKYFWEVLYLINTNKYNCCAAICECPFFYRIFYQNPKVFYLPSWLRGRTEIPIAVTNSSLKEDLRKIKKNQLEYAISTKPEDIHDFHYNMCIPTIHNRHQERAIEFGYEEVLQKINDGKCELLLVFQKGLAIAGISIITNEEVPQLWKSGIRNGESIYFKTGAQPATYYFASLYLSQKGFKEMGMGWTRSFLNDGILQFKKKLNVRLIGASKKGFILNPLIDSNSLRGFLINNPFIYESNGQFIGAVFIANNQNFGEVNFEKLKKLYDIQGLSELKFFQFDESDRIFSELTTTHLSQK